MTYSKMSKSSHNKYITLEECDEMITKAIDQHNKTATLISASLGGILLFFYADGMIRMLERMS